MVVFYQCLRMGCCLFLIWVATDTLSGYASTAYRFNDQEPITQLDDRKAIAIPATDKHNIREYVIASAARLPVQRYLNPNRIVQSQDVNALDDVPESSWFNHRLGYREMTPAEIVKGAQKLGPPQAPYRVVKLKDEGTNPGFHIKDSRGHRYLVKLDSARTVRFETTINFVVSRLFWAWGYNTPEDYVFHFYPDDLRVEEGRGLTQADLEAVLLRTIPEKNGSYRTTASLFLKGTVLGHPAQIGYRADDPQDRIPHEAMRVLRALKVFCALVQQTAMRSDNMLDVYEGPAGEGFVRHYLIDFGETMGVHGMSWQWRWDGFEHFFDWRDHIRDTLLLGLRRSSWEKIDPALTGIEAYYESNEFKLKNWKEGFQFEPIRQAQPDDDYWAAKIIARVKKEHLVALFQAAGHGNPKEEDYLIQTFMERLDIILEEVFNRVTPLEVSRVNSQAIQLADMAEVLGETKSAIDANRIYRVEYFDGQNKRIKDSDNYVLDGHNLNIPLDSNWFAGKDSYIRLRIQLVQHPSSRPAEFHLRKVNEQVKVAGVVH